VADLPTGRWAQASLRNFAGCERCPRPVFCGRGRLLPVLRPGLEGLDFAPLERFRARQPGTTDAVGGWWRVLGRAALAFWSRRAGQRFHAGARPWAWNLRIVAGLLEQPPV